MILGTYESRVQTQATVIVLGTGVEVARGTLTLAEHSRYLYDQS